MKKISYYPGCTLKTTALNFEDSTLFVLKKLDVSVKELEKWYCCGTVFSLATDDLIHHIAPIRNLIKVKEEGFDSVMTLCAMCYNTLKRSNLRMKKEPESLEKINRFMSDEKTDYNCDVEILHLLELLRDQIKFENIKKIIKKPLKNLKVSSYYGCLLVRPKEVGFDDVENPIVLENLMKTIGAEPIDFPYKTECCGSYQTVDNPEIIGERTQRILTSAQNQGADIIVVSCPLCAFNLDNRQKNTAEIFPDFTNIPVLYFTQLLAIALGCPKEKLGFHLHYIDPEPLLKEKGLI